MKKLAYVLSVLLIALSLLLTSCSSHKKYVTNAYSDTVKENTKIAIIPVRFTLSGLIVEKLSEDEIRSYEGRQSMQFQRALASRIVRKMGERKHDINVELQDVNVTNSKLKEGGFWGKDSYTLDAKKLGKILDVDAVMIVDVNSDQMFTDSEANIVKATSIVIDVLSPETNTLGSVPVGNMYASASIVDTYEGVVLWSKSRSKYSRTRKTPNEAMRQLNKNIIRSFPYRNEDFDM